VYCPNCGKKNDVAVDASCTKCGLPLGAVQRHLEENRKALVPVERASRVRVEKIVAQALFLGIAAIPIAIAARNTLADDES